MIKRRAYLMDLARAGKKAELMPKEKRRVKVEIAIAKYLTE
jgi:hypothetical protein